MRAVPDAKVGLGRSRDNVGSNGSKCVFEAWSVMESLEICCVTGCWTEATLGGYHRFTLPTGPLLRSKESKDRSLG